MPTVSHRVVHTLSTRKRGMSRVQCSNYTHNQSRGRRREVLRTEVTGGGDEKRGVVSVNMRRLGESFVEKVSDVRGWQSEARKQPRDKLLQLDSDIGLRVALTGAAGADIFFIPEIHFAGETPELDDEG